MERALSRRTLLAGAVGAGAGVVGGATGRAAADAPGRPVAQGAVDAEVARLRRG